MTNAPDTRERILDAALALASRNGAAGTSMRELADACGINVAALYYHFPSKEELLKSVIEERRYDLMLAEVEVPSADGDDRDRLSRLIAEIWGGVRAEEQVWRLLLAESCHQNHTAEEQASNLVTQFEETAAVWLAEEFDDLRVDVAVAARMLADFLFSNIARVAIGAVTDEVVLANGADLAAVIVDA